MTRPTATFDQKYLVLIAIVLMLLDGGLCILSNTQNQDITDDYYFNCQWRGGISSSLHCSCINDAAEFIIKQGSIPPYNVALINITNCAKITFESNALVDMRDLRIVTLSNIKSLVLKPDSLNWIGTIRMYDNLIDWDPTIPSLRIIITSSIIDEIANNAIHGRINLLEITDCEIKKMSAFAVSNLQQMLNIRIDGTTFQQLDTQSFKKFTTETLQITNSVFDTIPSRAFYDLTVRDKFILDNITVLDTIKPSGFVISLPYRFELTNSQINTLSGNAFNVSTRGPVTILNNHFNTTGIGAFRGIALSKDQLDPNAFETIKFERNVFDKLSKDALLVDKDSFRAEFINLQLTEGCECGNLERYFRHGENTMELSCVLSSTDNWVTVDYFQSTQCGMLDTKSGTAYIIAGVCLIVLILVGSIVGFYFFKLHRSKSYGNNSTDKNGKLSMIVPDGRTYKETELCVIVETTNMLTTDL